MAGAIRVIYADMESALFFTAGLMPAGDLANQWPALILSADLELTVALSANLEPPGRSARCANGDNLTYSSIVAMIFGLVKTGFPQQKIAKLPCGSCACWVPSAFSGFRCPAGDGRG